MATTVFGLTADDGTPGKSSAVLDAGFGGESLQALSRYITAGLTSEYSYPETEEVDGFYVPRMTFKFFDAFGRYISNSPSVKIRVPNNFNVTNFSEYNRTEAIFGAGMEQPTGVATQIFSEVGQNKIAEQQALSADDLDTSSLLQYGATSAEAFLYAVQKSIGAVSGFLISGGLNAISQAEFTGRAAVNPYAQLLYKGPQFRRYQVPVLFKPRNSKESTNALNIIKIFKLASSPAVQNKSITLAGGTYDLQSFVFGYPHLTQFSIDFKSQNINKTIFQSKLCAIESVAVDYGGQKMNFFEDGIPSEITLTLQMSEIAVRTLGDAQLDSNINRTII